MVKRSPVILLLLMILLAVHSPVAADDRTAGPQIQEEIWALPFPLPVLAFLVRPVGDGPFPLVIMNHGISLDANQRTMFPMIEYRDAARWFARRGYVVISPIRYGASSLDDKDQGLYGAVFAHVGSCDNPNFRGPGLAIATLNEWVIDYMSKKKMIQPGKVIVVGQSGGGWGSIALASLNPSSVQAIITFAAGRGGRVDGKPNNNCAPDKLVAATGEFGRTARIPMLWIYAENDTYFGPELTKRMHQAFVQEGGNVEYRMLPPFGSDGHFMIDSADAVPIWSPFVAQFIEKHSATATSSGQVSNASPQQQPRAKPPRLRLPENIRYSNWEKLCFGSSDGTTICRTTSTGTDDLDQVVVRVDLIQRADGPARLQLFVPQGANLQQGVKVTIDQGSPAQIPFNWCLTNICIAARGIEPTLAAQMEAGQQLKLELTDLNSSSVAINLPLDQFAKARKALHAKTFDFASDEE
ncbi:invasion associated locus B family protein [Bradyrhizobium sp. MOS002]|uniref:invasion associated locus B family protein n=1 Tax=Bradyrhizobium sp. MOS002 TaxID=2133947 RepID=UPI000D13D66F|nr:invasion associated locus B family protein [Bradyrhizobium sp. MOS002]PSO31497.1 dienelactone hydrolase [Bradyrhizobium sp. MOS002]